MTSSGPARARGSAFLGLVRFVREEEGAAALDRAVERAGPQTQAAFAERIRANAWYPYPALAGFLRALDEAHGSDGGAYLRRLGELASIADLSTTFSFFAKLYGPERLMRSCGRVWSQYYENAGTMRAISTAPDDALIVIEDFPEMAPEHCHLMEGWMIAAMRAVGAKVLDDSHERACPSRGDARHEFWARWRRL